ncbi:hypothetical protein [Roseinatronobacter bogoriensis]|uniref:hypothetical protein n=1 Tax=Roseinatronobacter bogoriensis TaxID=119542 RepID=UPI001063D79A|nr:hypothetical protein [Rhodobaca]
MADDFNLVLPLPDSDFYPLKFGSEMSPSPHAGRGRVTSDKQNNNCQKREAHLFTLKAKDEAEVNARTINIRAFSY